MTAEETSETDDEQHDDQEGESEGSDRLPADHPAAKALKKANAEAADLRRKVKEYEDADKTELEKATTKATDAEKRAEAAELKVLRLEVAADKGLPPKLASRLQGTTKEELEADADELLEEFGDNKPDTKKKPAARKKPAGDRKTSADGDDPDELEGKARAAAALRGMRKT